jgi:hypothetical protein
MHFLALHDDLLSAHDVLSETMLGALAYTADVKEVA